VATNAGLESKGMAREAVVVEMAGKTTAAVEGRGEEAKRAEAVASVVATAVEYYGREGRRTSANNKYFNL